MEGSSLFWTERVNDSDRALWEQTNQRPMLYVPTTSDPHYTNLTAGLSRVPPNARPSYFVLSRRYSGGRPSVPIGTVFDMSPL